MLYAELGRKPINISIKNRMIGYWLNIINSKNSKLSNLLYNILLPGYNAGIFQHKWIHCIREILISVGRIDLFNKVNVENTKSLKAQISEPWLIYIYRNGLLKLNCFLKEKIIICLSRI